MSIGNVSVHSKVFHFNKDTNISSNDQSKMFSVLSKHNRDRLLSQGGNGSTSRSINFGAVNMDTINSRLKSRKPMTQGRNRTVFSQTNSINFTDGNLSIGHNSSKVNSRGEPVKTSIDFKKVGITKPTTKA